MVAAVVEVVEVAVKEEETVEWWWQWRADITCSPTVRSTSNAARSESSTSGGHGTFLQRAPSPSFSLAGTSSSSPLAVIGATTQQRHKSAMTNQRGINTTAQCHSTTASMRRRMKAGRRTEMMRTAQRIEQPTPPCATGESTHAGTPIVSTICRPWSPYMSYTLRFSGSESVAYAVLIACILTCASSSRP